MHVRTARVEDAESIGRIHTVAWQVGYEHVFGAERLATMDVEERIARWRQRLAGKGDAIEGIELLVVEDDEREVVGWAASGRPEGDDTLDTAELYGLYVDPATWSQGAGAALMRVTLERLADRGFHEAILWVLEDNPRARGFYERRGWHPDGTTKTETFFDVPVLVVRYRVELEPAGASSTST